MQTRAEFGAWLTQKGYTRVAEVGVLNGEFSRHLLDSWSGELTLIDAWQHLSNYRDISNVDDLEHLQRYNAVCALVQGYTRAHVVRGISPGVANQFPDNYFDVVYIDANHAYEATKADLAAWYPKVKPGGALTGHDYLDGELPEGSFGVKRAVTEFFGRDPDIVTQEAWPSWVVYKPNIESNFPAIAFTAADVFSIPPISDATAAARLRAQAAHAMALSVPELTGRGIVIPAGGNYACSAYVTVRMLRHLGCNLPIQIWHLGPREMPPLAAAAFAEFGVETVDAHIVCKQFPHSRLNGWELKAYALLHSPWREVLLLDADNIPVQNVDQLFNTVGYTETGALFWPDRGRWPPEAIIWTLSGLDYRDEAEFESGQLVVDKQRCWPAVVLANEINNDSAFWYSKIHGDKDTFRLAWRSVNLPYFMNPHMGSAPWPLFYQRDTHGEFLFQHGYKWTLPPEHNRPFGEESPGYPFSAQCFNAIKDYANKTMELDQNAPPAQVTATNHTTNAEITGKKMSCAIVTGSIGADFDNMLAANLPVMYAYARRHNLDLAVTRLQGDRPPSWIKIDAILRLLRGYDIVAWLDADVVITNGVDNIFAAIETDKWQAVVEHSTECGNVPNCGVWVCRPQMIPFLQKVRDNTQYIDHPWWEQAAMIEQMGYTFSGVNNTQHVTATELYNHTQFLPATWNHHPRDVNRVESPNFTHVTQQDNRLESVRAHAQRALATWARGD